MLLNFGKCNESTDKTSVPLFVPIPIERNHSPNQHEQHGRNCGENGHADITTRLSAEIDR
jgi:hypothetical protein